MGATHYFRTTERFWLNLQTRYELEVVKDQLGDRLDDEIKAFAVQQTFAIPVESDQNSIDLDWRLEGFQYSIGPDFETQSA